MCSMCRRLVIAAPRSTLLDGRFGRLRAVVIGPDGALYASTTNGPGDRIIRITRCAAAPSDRCRCD